MRDAIGWLATVVFTASYFTKSPVVLRRVQGGAACVWMAYGVLLPSTPIIVANLIVASVAIASSFRKAL
jgi:hypothetical protein